mmetsp:Transcript_1896/g.4102  ORF Transcript_1896/g.4102 Transcript_1896/m.4102 type:complete len:80 (-) Transcript_1896:3726-3965(-)
MKRMGLDYEDLKTDNPGLVYCSISGYGPDGPWSTLPGYDVVIAGTHGLMSITGESLIRITDVYINRTVESLSQHVSHQI